MQDCSSARATVALALIICSSSSLAQDVEHAVELEEVVVTASPIGNPDRLATIAGSIGRDELQRGGANTLAEALARLPGVTSSGFAAGAGRPVIRGMDANRVRTLEDGIGTFDVSDVGPDHGVPLEPFAAERVEVVRGAATLRYGGQAIGGVVNAITTRVPLHLEDGALDADAVAGFGSVADSRDFGGQVNLRRDALALHADAFSRHSGDYDTPDGAMVNSWLRGKGGAVGGAWIGEANRLGLGVVRHESRYGIPGEAAYIDMEQTKLLLRSEWALPLGALQRLTVNAGWADYEHSEREEQETHATFTDEEWDVRAEALAGTIGIFRESALGAQAQRKDFAALGEGAEYLAPTRTDSRALFAFTESRPTERLRLQLGARVEQVQVDGTPADDVPTSRSFTPVSASAGMVFDPAPTWRAGFSLSTAARAPAQTELYARGVHEATGTWEIGAPQLRVERARSAELSLRWRGGGRVHADGSLWISDFRNYIYGELTGRTCSEEGLCVAGEGEELAELLYAQRDARFHGAEGHAEIELLHAGRGDLHLEVTADMVRAEFSGGAGHVPRIPPWRLGGGLSWQGERIDARVFLRYSGRQSRTGAGESPTASFTSLDAEFAFRPWGERAGVEIALTGRNLTDSRQRNAVALNKDEILLPGRDLRLAVRARLN
ncbi:MAG TPA: TonB-dependent receptor [Steroidobacteraceae bacterium]|nr:TonB-dependent receptor [Steroidobacteraceae bacterium]